MDSAEIRSRFLRYFADLVNDEHRVWGFTHADRHLVCAPLTHSAPLRFAQAAALPRCLMPAMGQRWVCCVCSWPSV